MKAKRTTFEDRREALKQAMRETTDPERLRELNQEWKRLEREEQSEQTTRMELDRGKPRKGEKLGPILNTLTNVIRILTEDPQWRDLLAYNERSRKLMLMKAPPFIGSEQADIFPRPLRDVDITQTRAWIEQAYKFVVPKDKAEHCFDLVCRARAYEPVREWMESLEWDHEPRLDRWMIDYLGAGEECLGMCPADRSLLERCKPCQSNAYIEAVSSKWLISGVARTFEPGCKVDHMLITEGLQGGMKSTTLAVLAKRVEWFTDHVPDLKHADCIRQIQEPLIIEMAELDVMRKQEAQTMKAFITRTHDDLTDKYQRFPVKLPRRCIFAGGTNESAYLKDHTGNRRYWSVRCTNADIEGLRKVVDQLWAEAVDRYHAGESWWLSDELEAIAGMHQEERREVDPWQDEVTAYVQMRLAQGKRTAFLDEIYSRLEIPQKDRTQLSSIRLRTCFEALGWRKCSPRNDAGENENGFSLPAKKPKTV